MISRYDRLLIYEVKRTTKIGGMGPFKALEGQFEFRTLGLASLFMILVMLPILIRINDVIFVILKFILLLMQNSKRNFVLL